MSLIHNYWRYDFYSQMLTTFFWLSHSLWNHYLAIRFRRWESQSIDFLSSGFQYISTDWVRCCHKWRDPPDWKMTQIEPLVHLSNWNRVVFKTHPVRETHIQTHTYTSTQILNLWSPYNKWNHKAWGPSGVKIAEKYAKYTRLGFKAPRVVRLCLPPFSDIYRPMQWRPNSMPCYLFSSLVRFHRCYLSPWK